MTKRAGTSEWQTNLSNRYYTHVTVAQLRKATEDRVSFGLRDITDDPIPALAYLSPKTRYQALGAICQSLVDEGKLLKQGYRFMWPQKKGRN